MNSKTIKLNLKKIHINLDPFSHIWENVKMRIERTPEFKNWFDKQDEKGKAQIDARLKNIELHNYFGDHKSLNENLLELRWKSGRRVYYSLILKEELTLVLLGGLKNAQKKDIQKARKILKRETIGRDI